MGYAGKVTSIYLHENDSKEAMKIIDTIAKKDDRSGRQVAEILIIRAGKDRAERIKQRKAERV